MPMGAERQRAVAYFDAGDFVQAAPLLVSLLARTPPDPLLLRLCGMALVRTSAAAQGVRYLARARRLAPQDPLAAFWHGIALQAAGQPAEAVPALEAGADLAPSDPAPLVHLSRVLLQLERPGPAGNAARRALALAPILSEAQHAAAVADVAMLVPAQGRNTNTAPDPQRLADAWLAAGLASLRLDRVLDARHAMQQALAAQPQHASAAAHLALVEHLCGEPATAIERLREVLSREPGCEIARLHLASRLILAGDPTGGLALLEGSMSAQPLRAHWQAQKIDALVQLERFDDAWAELGLVDEPIGDAEILLRRQHALLARAAGDHARAKALERHVALLAEDRDAAGIEHRINAHFALGALRNAERLPAEAVRHWQRGHELMKAAQPFSRVRHAEMVDRIIETFDRQRLTEGMRASVSDPTPVFIVGLPRTGTTLTEHILNAHPAIHGAGERLAVRETLVHLTATANANEATSRAAALDRPALDEAARDYLAALRAMSPASTRVLDKMPDNVFQLGFIATLLPGARVIWCTRDLRDVGLSIFQRRFLGHHPYAHDLGDLGFYMAQHERLLRHWRDALTLPLLTIDHADWVGNFDTTLRGALDFLGLPYDSACTRFFEQTRQVDTASRGQVNKPINAHGVGRWRPYKAQLAPLMRELR